MDRSSREFAQLSQNLANISLQSNTPLDDDDAHGLSGDEKGEREPDFLALLDVATEFHIPYLLLDKLGVPESDRDPQVHEAVRFG